MTRNAQRKTLADYPELVAEWHENGKKETEGTYKAGKLEGHLAVWHENGKKKIEGTIKDGEPEGLWTEWDENGKKTSERTF